MGKVFAIFPAPLYRNRFKHFTSSLFPASTTLDFACNFYRSSILHDYRGSFPTKKSFQRCDCLISKLKARLNNISFSRGKFQNVKVGFIVMIVVIISVVKEGFNSWKNGWDFVRIYINSFFARLVTFAHPLWECDFFFV